jgi:hypothetical protein
MAQTKPKAAQFYGVSGNGTAGQVLISDGNGGMSWGANTEQFTVSWATPTGQSLTYTQPNPQSSQGTAGNAFPSTTFTATKAGETLSGTATIAGLPTGITASQSYNNSGIGNILTVTLAGVFPGVDSLNTVLTLSGLTFEKTVSWATPTGQGLTYDIPSPQSSVGATATTFPTTTFTATKAGEIISGTATIVGLPSGITAAQTITGSGAGNTLTVTLTGTFPSTNSLNTALTLSGLTLISPLVVDFLVVAGGASGACWHGGGGGAGGYRTSYGTVSPITLSGGSMESSLTLTKATNYTVTVGGGGAGVGTVGPNLIGNAGSNSVFASITSTGGGYGSSVGTAGPGSGGSGGGANQGSGGSAVTSPVIQGHAGGNGIGSASCYTPGGGGGAGSVGVNASGCTAGDGGDGLSNSITGAGTFYAGGGGGGVYSGGTPGTGGSGVGGNGGPNSGSTNGSPGATNTGSGGGGANAASPQTTGSGGSGIVILRYPNSFTISGLSGTTTTVGTDKVTTFTNSGTGNIQFN